MTFYVGDPGHIDHHNDVQTALDAMGKWVTYTPTLTQTNPITITNTGFAKYALIGDTVLVQAKVIALGVSGGAGAVITLSLPTAAATAGLHVGVGAYNDGGTEYRGNAYLETVNTVSIAYGGVTSNPVGVSPSIAVAAGDYMWISVAYEAA